MTLDEFPKTNIVLETVGDERKFKSLRLFRPFHGFARDSYFFVHVLTFPFSSVILIIFCICREGKLDGIQFPSSHKLNSRTVERIYCGREFA